MITKVNIIQVRNFQPPPKNRPPATPPPPKPRGAPPAQKPQSAWPLINQQAGRRPIQVPSDSAPRFGVLSEEHQPRVATITMGDWQIEVALTELTKNTEPIEMSLGGNTMYVPSNSTEVVLRGKVIYERLVQQSEPNTYDWTDELLPE